MSRTHERVRLHRGGLTGEWSAVRVSPSGVITDRWPIHPDDQAVLNDRWQTAAADRPTVTDNARAEAERRYPSDVADRGLTYPTGAVREHSQSAFVAGAEWAAARAETTTATVEDAARLLRDEWMHSGPEVTWLHMARALDAHGLLATARSRPTRDDLARAIASGYETDHPTPNRHDYRAADAVLALLRGGA